MPKLAFRLRQLGLAGLLAFLAFMPMAHAGPVSAQSAPPYPTSTLIESITWDWSTLSQAAPGSDLWPVTWADDGNLYTSWGDGGGFGGTDSVGRVAMGFARLEGPPQSYLGVNINGGQNPLNLASFPSSGKTLGLLSVSGILYSWINLQNSSTPDIKLAWSADHGAAWQLSSWGFASSAFAPATFLNFGPGYAGAPDSYIYFYGGAWGQTGETYLGRAPISGILDQSTYEYFTGLDASNNPLWSLDISQRQPVFTDPNSVEFNDAFKPQVIYNSGVGRYILTWWHKGPGGLGIFDAPAPWGPWTTVYYAEDFGGMTSGGEGLSSSFPAKWMSADGLTMWNVFSVWGPGGEQGVNGHDHFNLVKATLTLKTQDTTPPTAPADLAATPISGTQIDLSWTAASDPESGIASYNVYRDNMLVGMSSAASFSDTSLTPGIYTYEVSAVNGMGAEGPRSLPVTQSTLSIINAAFSVTLQSRPAPPDASWALDFTVDLYTPGSDRNTTPPVSSFSVTTDQNGQFTLNVAPGIYDIRAKGENTLATELLNVDLTASPASPVDLGLQRAGDYNGDNVAGGDEYNAQILVFGSLTTALSGTDQLLDFNGDGVVDTIDYAILVQNFGLAGAPP